MSQENLEIVRRGYEAYARGDLEALIEITDHDVVWTPAIAPLLGVEPIRGIDGLRRFLTEDIPAGFDDFEAKPLSMDDLGDAVLVRTRYSGRGRASGVPVSLEAFTLIVLRDGITVSLRDYEAEAEALEAAEHARQDSNL
jgi:ketosteroid isomerase-like protein